MYRLIIRPLLFLLSSEQAHAVAMHLLMFVVRLPFGKRMIRSWFAVRDPALERKVFGLRFPNPLGIAAGFDKNATYLEALSSLGFGHIEIGTVTPRAQPGNPKPRLFRLKKSRALINRMGFNNDGCIAIAHRLQKFSDRTFILGANIGKNKDTPNAQAVEDYLACFDNLHSYVDYFVVNVSSPNTPGLRELQDRGPLTQILNAIMQRNADLPQRKPILLKIAPDLTDAQLDDIISLATELHLSGIVVSNTTISREGLLEDSAVVDKLGNGGMSGAPLRRRAHVVLQYLRLRLPEEIVLIGVGGIDSAEIAYERISAGAKLIQIYTGFIYEGPSLLRKILQRLAS